MLDVIGAYNKVRESYIQYIRTAFGTEFPGLESERENLLRKAGTLSQEPWLEPLPRYLSSGKKVNDLGADDLPGLTPESIADFKKFISCGLIGDYPLHMHQVNMLTKVLSGKNCVVTAGTGSGKTEAFLLPLFARLVAESATWDAPTDRVPYQNDWWCNETWRQQCMVQTGKGSRMVKSLRVSQRANEKRFPAVRALILYPMNALVEDQLSRLRRAIDSPEARTWFQTYRKDNRISFGRYNGETPVPGHEYDPPDAHGNLIPIRSKIEELAEILNKTSVSTQSVDDYQSKTGDEDVRYFFPRLDGAEMRSRWDMQNSPPDILITNFSMLSIMLMRDADADIFNKTKEWLKKDSSVFHLIVDELHLYRGTAGTEVAYLLRLLLLKLGLTPSSPKLRILASSASLEPGDPQSIKFLTEFFGTDWTGDQIIPGYPATVPPLKPDSSLPAKPFLNIAEHLYDANIEASQVQKELVAVQSGKIADAGQLSLDQLLESNYFQLTSRMLTACSDGSITRATPFTVFAKRLFGETIDVEMARKAARGLLVARSLCSKNSQLPSFRVHWFFRNIEGLWACTKPGCGCTASDMEGNRTTGQLFSGPRILCDTHKSPHRVLELLYCEVCGTTLFGGSRLKVQGGGGWELMTTDPDVEGIPDKQASALVERRTYGEFALFWPQGNKDLHEDSSKWKQPTLDGKSLEGRWRQAKLNPGAGRVQLGGLDGDQDHIPGYVYLINSNEENSVSALPALCPRCGANYSHRKFRRSPIRGFRTGFSKITQLLSKEFFYFLPEDSRKLVIFSDSREDAASLANGVERSHYSDLVREAMYDELSNIAMGEPSLLQEIHKNGVPVSFRAKRFAESHPGAEGNLQKMISLARAVIPEGLDPILRKPMEEEVQKAKDSLSEIEERGRSLTLPARVLFESDGDGPGLLIQRLKAIGVNPAGNDGLFQDFKYDGDFRRWTTIFDFGSPESGWRTDLSPEGRAKAREKLRQKVTGEVCAVLFARLYFGFESAGLGYTRLDVPQHDLNELAAQCGMQPPQFASVCDATLRVMGDLYRYQQDDPDALPVVDWPDWQSARASLRNYLKACARFHSVSETALFDAVWQAICERGGHSHLKINPRRLLIRVSLPTDPVWICPSCRRAHLYNPGVCTSVFCQKDLVNAVIVNCAALHERNYYSTEAVQLRQPIRLHCEELTAQTDDQAERQRLFRDITVDLKHDDKHPVVPEADKIDILSVTTTMEVGVDIGRLQGVVMGNMPPMRFNYQQRAGRAGRRGQSFAVVLTICRGRSHDDFYYRHPERITGDTPPVPFLSMARPEIAQRVVAKELLKAAFFAAGVRWWESPVPPDTHGEFGTVSTWLADSARQQAVKNWLETSNIEEVTAALCSGPGSGVDCSELNRFARGLLYARLNEIVANPELTGEGLAERLAEGGVLPMYGMPSRVRLLYHKLEFDKLEKAMVPRTIERDLDLAITEFAPGSQRTKDKRVHKAIGFTAPLVYRRNRWIPTSKDPLPSPRWMAKCEHCHRTRTSDSQPSENACPWCGCGINDKPAFRIFRFAVPLAFRTNLGQGEDAKEEGELLAVGVSTTAESYLGTYSSVQGTNSSVAYYGAGRVYRVNDRRGELFSGSLGRSLKNRMTLDQQWIDNRFQSTDDLDGFVPTQSPDQIAIVAPKTTDVLHIRPNTTLPGLTLDPLESAGVKAAYYSAAFILRSIASEKLDIDPDEFEISNVCQVELPDNTRAGEITVNDHLANGAGFTAWLGANLDKVLQIATSTKEPSDTFIGALTSTEHQKTCDSSGYDCLRNYRNMAYHGLLDWRLGISVLRALNSVSFDAGLGGNFNLPDLEDWLDLATRLRDTFCSSFAATPCQFGPLPGMKVGGMQIVVVHPLWNPRNPVGLLAQALAMCEQESTRTLDTFNLLRRGGWAYRSLG